MNNPINIAFNSAINGHYTGMASTPGSASVYSGDNVLSRKFKPKILGTYTATESFLISLNGGTAASSVEITDASDYLQMSKAALTEDVSSTISTTGYSAVCAVTVAELGLDDLLVSVIDEMTVTETDAATI